MRILNFLCAVIFLFLPFSGLNAQEFKQTPMPKKTQQIAPEISVPQDIKDEMTIIRDDYAGQYNFSNLENLSKLYWRLGAFDSQDEKSIENYIKINDCKIFENFSTDDFEWKKIITSMKSYLSTQNQNFSLKYQFLISLNLGKYDGDQGGFPLINNTGFQNSRLINVQSSDFSQTVCKDNSINRNYPKSVIILLPKPFNLTFLKVDEHIAQAYILKNKKNDERTASLRLRISFNDYLGNMRGENNSVFSVLNGHVDGYEIFEDSTQRNLLLSVDFLKDSKIKTGAVSLPSKEMIIPSPMNDTMAVGFTSQ